MRRTTPTQTARYLAYCEFQLDSLDLTPERRSLLKEKADFYRRALAGRCRRCGRTLTDPNSVLDGIGPECAAILDQKDADDRAFDAAQSHELSRP